MFRKGYTDRILYWLSNFLTERTGDKIGKPYNIFISDVLSYAAFTHIGIYKVIWYIMYISI